jgi:hypothetical protein
MAGEKGRDRSASQSQDVAGSQRAIPESTKALAEGTEGQSDKSSHLLPYAKPYNEYFNAVNEAQRGLCQRLSEIYTTYVEAMRDAIEARDGARLVAATEKYYAAWIELAKPTHMRAVVSRAFDTYQREMKSAFASGATGALGPGCLGLVAYSMAVVASHRIACGGASV